MNSQRHAQVDHRKRPSICGSLLKGHDMLLRFRTLECWVDNTYRLAEDTFQVRNYLVQCALGTCQISIV